MKKHKIKNNIKVDISKYVNSETGVPLIDDIPKDTRIISTEDSGIIKVSSSNYAVIDSEAVEYLMSVLSNVEIAYLMKMAITTKTPLNIIYNNNIPHTNETLKQYLQLSSSSTFSKLIKKLTEEGVLYQIKGKIYGRVRVIYMLNPYITRKRSTFDSKVFEVFSKLSKKIDK
jgi:predicted transcriptional regulator